jgi:hypothetical protein
MRPKETVQGSVFARWHHFKAVTAMTPVQYQQQIRLQGSRRLLLSENIDASTAGRFVAAPRLQCLAVDLPARRLVGGIPQIWC